MLCIIITSLHRFVISVIQSLAGADSSLVVCRHICTRRSADKTLTNRVLAAVCIVCVLCVYCVCIANDIPSNSHSTSISLQGKTKELSDVVLLLIFAMVSYHSHRQDACMAMILDPLLPCLPFPLLLGSYPIPPPHAVNVYLLEWPRWLL